MNALLGPFALEEHFRADHRGDAGRVADRLRTDFRVALLMVAHVVNVVVDRLAVLHAVEDATDVRLALRARSERRGVGQQGLEKFDRDDLLPFETDVDLGVEVRRERIAVIATVAVEDVERFDRVE